MIRALVVMVIVAGLLTPIQSILLGGNPARAAQSDLTASLSPAGETFAPSSFTDLTTETFDSVANVNAGTTLAIGTVADLNSGTITAQSGGTYTNPTNTTYTFGSTSRAVVDAGVYGGSGGTGKFPYVTSSNASTSVVGGMKINLINIPNTSPADNTYRYIGFWWSGGNIANIVRLYNDGVEQATFTAANLIDQLGGRPSTKINDDYFGNPTSNFNGDDNPCPTGNICQDAGFNEPYAYIHLRYSPGFDEIQFIGRGFEFDSISIRRYVPASDPGEVAIVGSGVVSSCSAFADTNSQYVLRNGSFEDDYLTASTGTASAPLSGITTSNTTTDIAKWVRYSGGPYQFTNLYDATSSNANRIPFWQTSAWTNANGHRELTWNFTPTGVPTVTATHQITAEFLDAAGAVINTQSSTVIIDVQAPTLTSAIPTAIDGTNLPIQVTASDESGGSGLAGVIITRTVNPVAAAAAFGPAAVVDQEYTVVNGYVTIPNVVLGESMTVKVRDRAGNISASSFTVAALNRQALNPVAKFTGTAKVGQTLTLKPGTWPKTHKVTYQWLADGVNIAGATKTTFKLTNTQAGKRITIAVTGTRATYYPITVLTPASTIVTGGTLTGPTPTIAGNQQVGQTLTATAGAWANGVNVTYAWKRGTVTVGTGLTYTLVAADKGKKITFTATGTKQGFNALAKTSTTGVIKP